MTGRTVGFVANQPLVLAGCLDIDSQPRRPHGSCAFATASTSPSSPSSTYPASCPAPARNMAASSSMAQSCCSPSAEATVPKVTVITRKAYGGAYDVMSSKHLRGRRELCLADRRDRGDGAQGRGGNHLPRRYRRCGQDRKAHRGVSREVPPTRSLPAPAGYIDDVILPRNTRRRVCRALAMLRDKQLENPWKKHDNIPL